MCSNNNNNINNNEDNLYSSITYGKAIMYVNKA